MARYIKKYADETAIHTAVENNELLKPYVAYNEDLNEIDWNSYSVDYTKMYLTIEALEEGEFIISASVSNTVSYSINGSDWTEVYSNNIVLPVQSGDKIRLKRGSQQHSAGDFIEPFTQTTILFNVFGNIASWIYGDDFTNIDYPTVNLSNFPIMFKNTSVVDASNLIIPNFNYLNGSNEVFAGCTSLIAAPELPAELGTKNRGYYYMFQNCTSLTKAPVISTETIGNSSCRYMFDGCTSLNYIKCLATSVNSYNTGDWVRNVASTGTFVKKAGVTWPTGSNGIPNGWTVIEE